jgi:7,8-dihydropterin-6-yl-methyl-4-(beta-D-ribofuranosyl)aminobenzene 5'-phosphate synthase
VKKVIYSGLISFILIITGVNIMLAKQEKPIKITILFDNYLYHEEGLKAKWGFACLVEGFEKTILFDTGSSGELLLSNARQLNVDPQEIDLVVISHKHWDHVGGLPAFLEVNPHVTVYMPASVAEVWAPDLKKRGAKLVAVSQPVEICKQVFLTGEIEGPVNEQALILDTPNGQVVITGCAHPGIVQIVKKARDLGKTKPIYMVLGGFHLKEKPVGEVKQIIEEFRQLGVVKAGPTHCSGEDAIRLFKEAFGENSLELGVGKVIEIGE